ncbi:MAG: cell division topological specificity factor MinE [Synergistaceae bacterium]|jgi:cell division topological specificity factor|nr:cell division topological specificity factor MinE [Synergistaceae bacterium]
MSIRSLLSSIFGSRSDPRDRYDDSPGQVGMDRLAVLLVHDRADISPGMMENMKLDIIEVIKKYIDIDENQIDLALENEDESVALLATIPIKNVLRRRGRAAK